MKSIAITIATPVCVIAVLHVRVLNISVSACGLTVREDSCTLSRIADKTNPLLFLCCANLNCG